eukprot:CAMPEP_0182572038 /NCGR_PEP_ID=MMETSP1324-20130603/15755_1 /TAXON_ID=236786 /ORGANISM="Florenciella sp., Strain RCC1587" /LENGTH=50 /DNA_ID=CAMNT_0024786819 /DNA_START=102 /DNA_END=254 /DNA_ORIENTATION=-
MSRRPPPAAIEGPEATAPGRRAACHLRLAARSTAPPSASQLRLAADAPTW